VTGSATSINSRARGINRVSRNCGFTLIELLTALTVAAVLLMIGVPSFNNASLSARLGAISSNLYAGVQLARSEAIKRNIPITLCRSTDGMACASASDWASGWIVIDTASTTVFHRQQAEPTGFKVVQSGTASGGDEDLVFQPIGIGASRSTFTICRSSPVGSQERVLQVSATGIAYVTRTEAGVCP
jgi:type IV fimbrial biogenesis protein FimT